jgi:hypothetical protein
MPHTAVPALKISVPSLWDLVRDVRSSVANTLHDADPDLREAAVMAASELVENAIKYGQTVAGHKEATLEVHCEPSRLVIHIRSGVRSPDAAESMLGRLRAIREAKDKNALYIARLRDLMRQPQGASQLGLYRIAAEGGFELDGRIDGDVLHITATRALA